MTFAEYTNKQDRFALTCNMTGALMALRGGPASGVPYIRVGGLGPPAIGPPHHSGHWPTVNQLQGPTDPLTPAAHT